MFIRRTVFRLGPGTYTMPTIQITDDKKYARAIGLLYEMGGLFRTQPTRQLVIGPAQLQALQRAGLVPKANGARKGGQKNRLGHRLCKPICTPSTS
jgi:hypothetical protein